MNGTTHADEQTGEAVEIEALIIADGSLFDASRHGLSRTGPWGSVHSNADADDMHEHGDAPRIVNATVPEPVADALEAYAEGNGGMMVDAGDTHLRAPGDGYEAANLLREHATDTPDGPRIVWPEHVAGEPDGSAYATYYDDAERAECLECGHVAYSDPTDPDPFYSPEESGCPNCLGVLTPNADAWRSGWDAAELCDDEGATADELHEWADATENVTGRNAQAFADGVRAYADQEGA